MPRADTHKQAAQNAREAADQLVGVAEGKRAVAADPQEDRFARTADEAARANRNE